MTFPLEKAGLPAPPTSLLRGCSLFLDFDGTLVHIAERPDAIEVSDHLKTLLDTLRSRLEGRVVILTGRPADDIFVYLGDKHYPVCGHHGIERRNLPASDAMVERPVALDDLLDRFRLLEEREKGIIVEEKPFGIALHYRQAPAAEEACRAAMRDAARSTGLVVQEGKMVFELKMAEADKGRALDEIARGPGFAGHAPVFIGDDLTDEPGFEAARSLGGAGILVGDRNGTAARFALPGPDEALEWLEAASKEAA